MKHKQPKCCTKAARCIALNEGNMHKMQKGWPNDYVGWYMLGLKDIQIYFCPFCATKLETPEKPKEDKIMTNADLESMIGLRDKHIAESSPAIEKNFKAQEMIRWVYAEMVSKKNVGNLPTLEELYDKFNEDYKDEVGEE